MPGTERVLNWEKLGLVLGSESESKPEWISEFFQAPNAIELENCLRVYFCTRSPKDSNGQYESRVTYVDVSKVNPTHVLRVNHEPVLSLGGTGSFDQRGTYPFSPIVMGEGIIAAYGGWSRCESVPFDVSIGLARSSDGGNTFIKEGTGPILTKSLQEPFVISSPKIRFYNNKYYLFYIAGSIWIDKPSIDPIYSIRVATSKDGVNWNKNNQDIIPKILGDDEAQASPDVFLLDGQYHMLFCYRYGTDFRNGTRGYRIGYAVSDDLMNWRREDSLSDLTISENGWDSESLGYPNVISNSNGIFVFYHGNEVGRYGFGVARLRSIHD